MTTHACTRSVCSGCQPGCSKSCINKVLKIEYRTDDGKLLKCNNNLIAKYIKENRCIDCIKYILIHYSDLSYEKLKRIDFKPWFKAIKRSRFDVLCALLEYGCERYSEYIDDEGRDSFCVLIDCYYIYGYKQIFEQIFDLFISAGIEVTKDSLKCINYERKRSSQPILKILDKYGYDTVELLSMRIDEEDEDRIVEEREIFPMLQSILGREDCISYLDISQQTNRRGAVNFFSGAAALYRILRDF